MYKVPQDVEAEDKFVGPLTFKQFLFGSGAIVSGYLIFLFMTKGIWPLALVLFPFFVVTAALAFPWSKDQPTELWLASRIRFMLVPRRRVWDQSGVKDLVQVTVPKREVHIYSDGLTQDQVRNRLSALATVVDTRGWAVKNASNTDRLIQASQQAAASDNETILASTADVMDEKQNPLAQQFDSMIQASEDKHRQQTLAMIQEARDVAMQPAAPIKQAEKPTAPDAFDTFMQGGVSAPAKPSSATKQAIQEARDASAGKAGGPAEDFWFLHEQPTPPDPSYATFREDTVVAPGAQTAPAPPAMGMGVPVNDISKAAEQQLLEKVHKQQAQEAMLKQHSHLKTLVPLSEQPAAGTPDPAAAAASTDNQAVPATGTTPVDPAIMALASNDDLSVETLARQAKKDLPDDEEVVINLH